MTKDRLTLALTFEAARIRSGGSAPVYLGHTAALALREIGLPLWHFVAANYVSIMSPLGIPAIDEAIFAEGDLSE